MRSLLLIVCVLAMPCVSSAQSNQSSWGNLNTLRPGQKIEVVETNLKKDRGTFAAVSDDAIRINEPTGEQTIPRASVMRVTLRQNKHRRRNALIGALVGGGAGAGIGAGVGSATDNGTFFRGLGTDIGAVLGLGIGLVGGTITGAAWPSHPTIYRANAH